MAHGSEQLEAGAGRGRGRVLSMVTGSLSTVTESVIHDNGSVIHRFELRVPGGFRRSDADFMTGDLPDACDRLLQLRELLQLQEGVITRAQALSAGMSRHALQAKLDSERWRRLHSGVYATFSGPPGRAPVLWAAVLGAGPRAILSHETAA